MVTVKGDHDAATRTPGQTPGAPPPNGGLAALLTDIAHRTGGDDGGSPTLSGSNVDAALRPRHSRPQTVAFELLLGYGLLVVLELWLGGGTLHGHAATYHPYWLVVLPMAAARGLGAGTAAALVGCALLVVAAIGAGAADTPAEALLLDTMVNGVAFVLVAFVIGWIRDEIRSRQEALWRRHVDLAAAHEVTMRIEERLLDSNRRLKLRLLDQTAQFGSLIDAARTLRGTDESHALELLLQLVEEQCGAAACSVLRVSANGELHLAARRGWPEGSAERQLRGADTSPLVARAQQDGGRAVDAFTAGSPPPGDGPLVVVPLTVARGRVTALLCIDQLPAHRFTSATTSLLAAIAAWSSESSRDGAMARSIALDERLGSAPDLAVRLKGEVGRGALTDERAAVLAVRVEGGPQADRETAAVLLPELMHAADGLYETGIDGALAIVLPATSVAAARQAGRRFAARLQAARPQHVTAAEFTVVGLPENLHDLGAAFAALESALGAALPIGLADAAGYAHGVEEFVRDLHAEAELATRIGQEIWIAVVNADGAGSAEILDEVLAATAAGLEPPAVAYRIDHGRAIVLLPAVSGDEAFAVAHGLEHEARARGADPESTCSEVLAFSAEAEETRALLEHLLAGIAALDVDEATVHAEESR